MRSDARKRAPHGLCLLAVLSLCWLGACGRIGVEILPLESTTPNDDRDGGASDMDAEWRPGADAELGPDSPNLAESGLLDAAGDGRTADDAGPDSADNCTATCMNTHGTASCVGGTCNVSCALGYADCDGNPANGCEVDTASSVNSCGTCTEACTNPHGQALCSSGLCAPSCQAGFSDCDADAQNGCEADLAATAHCGACDVSCSNAHGTTSCVAAKCVPGCAAGYADCDGNLQNGCETNTASDPAHCGSCPNACGSNGQICVNGACAASPCAAGRGECDGNLAVTCETDTTSSLSNCGFCGNVCSTANGTPRCTTSACQVNTCNTGYGDCDTNAGNGCEAQLTNSVAHCGSCPTACSNAHGSTSCSASTCAPQCSTGYGDCDTSRPNGCETALDSISNCGMCGRTCPANGGTAVCQAGVCNTLCNLTGTFALKLTVPITWPNATYISSGSGTFQFWLKLQGTHSGNSLSGTLTECGRYTPAFRASMVSENYSFQHPSANFDRVPPSVPSSNVTLTLNNASPGATITLPSSATQMGVRMADPINGAWPGSASGLTQVDDDMNGKPGVSVVYENGGSGGYMYPRTSASLFGFTRSDIPYIASRLAFSLGGSLTSCTQASGSATLSHIDTRIFGCSLSTGSSDCNGSEASFLDQNCVNYNTPATASYTLLKVADGASCATIRSALP